MVKNDCDYKKGKGSFRNQEMILLYVSSAQSMNEKKKNKHLKQFGQTNPINKSKALN